MGAQQYLGLISVKPRVKKVLHVINFEGPEKYISLHLKQPGK